MDETDLDYDVDLDELLDLDVPGPSTRNTAVLHTESAPVDGAASGEPETRRRYLSKRPHKKSRAGCKQCKRRKVKVLLIYVHMFSSSLMDTPPL